MTTFMSSLNLRRLSFVIERYPFAVPIVERALESCPVPDSASNAAIEKFRQPFRKALANHSAAIDLGGVPDPTPGVAAKQRLSQARQELLDACDGLLAREAIAASLSADERREILRGMVLTRAVDNRLKQFFTSNEVRHNDVPFQGKGFRSLGQEAIYAAGIRLKRGPSWRDAERGWQGDIIGPIIRD